MFRSVSHGGRTFSKDKIVYGLDEKSKSLLLIRFLLNQRKVCLLSTILNSS